MALVALLSIDSGVVYSIIQNLIFKESFILACNCVIWKNIIYFNFISDFSGSVSVCE
jgi:hypothetical protein